MTEQTFPGNPAVRTLRELAARTICTAQKCVAATGLIAAFAAVYVIWGSTYLAISFAIETLPPFAMAAIRFTIAGALLYVWARLRGAARPQPLHWRGAFITGGLMLLGGNGAVVWAEQFVPSGLTALLVATVPLWVVLVTVVATRTRPSLLVTAGVLLGLLGIVLLIGPDNINGGDRMVLVGSLVLILGTLSWAVGTYYSRSVAHPQSQSLTSAMNMLAGGLLFAAFSAVNGEFGQLNLAAVSLKSWLATGYLVIFGSLIGFSAYMWLVQVTTPAQASSNFYVNPVVAVILGWLFAGEVLTTGKLIAAVIIVAAVALIITQKGRNPTGSPPK